MDVHFYHARIRSHFDHRKTWIEGRRVTLQRDRDSEVRRGVLNRGDQIQIVAQEFDWREEDIEDPVAYLSAERWARHPGGGFSFLRDGRFLGRLERTERRKRAEEVTFALRPFRKFLASLKRVGLVGIFDILRLGPRERFQRQPVTQRRIARDQEKMRRCCEPRMTGPIRRARFSKQPAQRKNAAHIFAKLLLEDPGQPLAFNGVRDFGIQRIYVHRKAPFAPEIVERILVSVHDERGIHFQTPGQGFHEQPRVARAVLHGGSFATEK